VAEQLLNNFWIIAEHEREIAEHEREIAEHEREIADERLKIAEWNVELLTIERGIAAK
jgi:hypothetical protein